MISNILLIAALAGLSVATCPLSVKISGATAHDAHVAVTNIGDQTITFFKGNTVLSDHATKDLLVADAGKAVFSHSDSCIILQHQN
jgi:deuterolysin